MAKVYFKLDLNKDIANWWGACNSSFMGVDWKLRISPKLRGKIVGKNKKTARKFLKPYLKQRYKKEKRFIDKFNSGIKDYWDEKEKEIFKRIRKITGKPIWPKKIICYYTTFPRGMYKIKENYAWVQLDPKTFNTNEFFCRCMLHEILHFQFHKYFWSYCKKLGLKKARINHIKEATTFLINEEFLDLIHNRDGGYKIHQNFRNDLSKIWRKNKNFKELLKKAVSLIKIKYPGLK